MAVCDKGVVCVACDCEESTFPRVPVPVELIQMSSASRSLAFFRYGKHRTTLGRVHCVPWGNAFLAYGNEPCLFVGIVRRYATIDISRKILNPSSSPTLLCVWTSSGDELIHSTSLFQELENALLASVDL